MFIISQFGAHFTGEAKAIGIVGGHKAGKAHLQAIDHGVTLSPDLDEKELARGLEDIQNGLEEAVLDGHTLLLQIGHDGSITLSHRYTVEEVVKCE